MVHKLALFRDDTVWIERALLLVESRVCLPALPGGHCSAKTKLDFRLQLVATILTFPSHRGCLDVGPAGCSDDTWNYDQLAYKAPL